MLEGFGEGLVEGLDFGVVAGGEDLALAGGVGEDEGVLGDAGAEADEGGDDEREEDDAGGGDDGTDLLVVEAADFAGEVDAEERAEEVGDVWAAGG